MLIVLLAAAGLYIAVQQKSDELQTAQDTAQKYAEQGKAFDVFEKKEQDLAARQAITQTALADRLNLGKIAEEISLVLPDEVWLDSMTLDEENGVSFHGNTPRPATQSMNVAYKSIAKTLVRLNELRDINDVWLSNATNGVWNAWDVRVTITSDYACRARSRLRPRSRAQRRPHRRRRRSPLRPRRRGGRGTR